MILHSPSLAPVIQKMNLLGAQQKPFLFVIDFEMEKPMVLALEDIDPTRIRYKFQDLKNYDISPVHHAEDFLFEKYPVGYEKYQDAFSKVMSELLFGNTFLTNLTFPTKIKSNLSLLTLFNKSRARYKLYMDGKFIVFSPESFVQIKDGKISSYPMKGTIDADLPDAQNRLMSDEKEIAEHYTIVDLIRNDLSMVSNKVEVTKFRYLDLIQTTHKRLFQTSSAIEGILAADYRAFLGDIIFTLLPAGSISGAPKKKTVEIIRSAEGQKRGYYTGIMGYFDGTNLDSAVMIRYIEQKNGEMFFRSGCGITALSDCMSEYNEMIDKVYVPIG
ncbi:MAG: aminodeoxychorismate synthase component I [Saprospiraceae bacterium]|nr:aminodeoxychorismate synthase component I [Saprospiraceae bacterium]